MLSEFAQRFSFSPHQATVAGFSRPEQSMPTGFIKMWDIHKGFGFIKPDDGSPDVFIHISALKHLDLDDLEKGDRVSFETEPGKPGKGLQAKDVKVLAAI